jgi:putative DNA primase/helicase
VAFLERITEDFANAKEFASNLKNNFLERYLPKGTKGQVCRVANRFALIAAAGELATLLGVTGWPVGEATEAAWKCFNTWLETKGCINGTTKAILDQVQAFFKKNGCRFQEISDKTRPKSDCAGFRAVESEGEIVFYVFPSVFRSEVCAGLDFNEVCRVLTENEVMEKGKDSHITKLKRIPALGKAVRCYHIIFKNWDNGA